MIYVPLSSLEVTVIQTMQWTLRRALLILSLLWALPATAGTSWQQAGFPRQLIWNQLATDPSDSQILYAAGYGALSKSVNGGVSWDSIGISGRSVYSVAADPAHIRTIYAGTDRGVFISQNGGGSWSALKGPIEASVKWLHLDQTNNSQIIYAGTPSGIFKSVDGGDSWVTLAATMNIVTFTIDKNDSRIIYALIDGSGIFKSGDGGDSWTAVNSGLPRLSVTAMVMDPADSQILYAAVGDEVFRTLNGGGGWSVVSLGWSIDYYGYYGGTSNIRSLAIDPADAKTIYAGTYGSGVYKSADGGGTWTPASTGLTDEYVDSLSMGGESHTIYAAAGETVFKSTDSGGSWSAINGINTESHALVADPSNSQIVYAGTPAGVFKSEDGGSTWVASNDGLPITDIYSLAIDPASSRTIYAGASNGAFKSVDGGAAWSALAGMDNGSWSRTPVPVLSLAIDPANSQTVLAGTSNGLFKSTNGGGSWSWVDTGAYEPYLKSVAIAPADGLTIYAATRSGVYKSVDGGSAWSAVNTGLDQLSVNAVAIAPGDHPAVFAGTSNGVFKSIDGGASWRAVNPGIIAGWVTCLAVDPTDRMVVFAGTSGSGVFKTANGGGSWDQVNSGLSSNQTYSSSIFVDSLAIGSTGSQTIYAGTLRGVFKGVSLLDLPAIGGAPPVAVTADHDYRFIPTMTGSTGLVSFSIINKPSWASFDTGSGALTGTPTVADAGAYSNIVIGVANAVGAASLAPFSISVSSLPPPTISGTPGAGVTAGSAYWFMPAAGNVTSFAIANKPSWASFDPATGALQGTPANINAGSYPNIVISVANSGASASLPAFSVTVTAAATIWQNTGGLAGASVTTLVVDPGDNQTLYAGIAAGAISMVGRLYKSTNGGASWNAADAGMAGLFIDSLSIDPSQNKIVYAGTSKGVFKTTDGGLSWKSAGKGLVSGNIIFGDGIPNVYCTAIDRNNGQRLYAGTDNGVYTSTDGGETWNEASQGLTSSANTALAVFSLVSDPNDGAILYAGTSSGVYRSTNAGASWEAANTGLSVSAYFRTIIPSLALDPHNSQLLYAATPNGIFKTTDGGNSWSGVKTTASATAPGKAVASVTMQQILPSPPPPAPEPPIRFVAVSPVDSRTIHAVTEFGGLLTSTDGGGSWNSIDTGLANTIVTLVADDPTENGTVYAGTLDGVLKSVDGSGYASSNIGVSNAEITALAIDPTDTATIYAATTQKGIFKSINGGGSWSAVSSGLPRTSSYYFYGYYNDTYPNAIGNRLTWIFALVIDPTNPRVLYAGTGEGVYQSTDGGGSWSAANNGLPKDAANKYPDILTLAMDPGTGSILAGTSSDGVYKSVDKGFSWTERFLPWLYQQPVTALMVDFKTHDIYAGSSTGVSSTAQLVHSHSSVSALHSLVQNQGLPSVSVTSLVMDPSDHQTTYAGTEKGLYKTTDGGSAWSAVNHGLPATTVTALVIDPIDGKTIYVAINGKVYRSINGAATWSSVGDGFSGTSVTSLVVDPSNALIVYAGTDGDGVLKGYFSGVTGVALSTVTASDVQDSIRMWLGLKPVDSAVDTNENGIIEVPELQKIMNGFLGL